MLRIMIVVRFRFRVRVRYRDRFRFRVRVSVRVQFRAVICQIFMLFFHLLCYFVLFVFKMKTFVTYLNILA